MNKNSKGITLIALVITIIVIIILAAAIILTLGNNNPINSANEATLKNDLSEFKSELIITISNEFLNPEGVKNIEELNQQKVELENRDISYIPSMI